MSCWTGSPELVTVCTSFTAAARPRIWPPSVTPAIVQRRQAVARPPAAGSGLCPLRVLARLFLEPALRLEHVPLSGPRVGGTARHLAVAEVSSRRARMPRREVELLGSLVVQSRRP